MRKNFLRSTLANESKAYGFTIAFWGSGALLVNYSGGLPTVVEALMYGLGAITGFAALILYSYRNTFSEIEYEESDVMVLSMVHYVAALLPVAMTYYTGRIEPPYNFLITGFSVSMLYNLGMILEEILSEKGRKLEQMLYQKL
ncbi:MAG: hypothetical protein BRC29_00895 [Nanohaloarchaea archaeon SW_7_43_1]|nr:MAG: hypothetical protein BRC29_00895 [Nanohaloarchaea archaeon SW_7_43_1]